MARMNEKVLATRWTADMASQQRERVRAKEVGATARRPDTPRGGYIANTPIPWITQAAGTTLMGLRMALALLHLRGMRKRDSFILAVPKQWATVMPRAHRYKGLRALEKAGLVQVERRMGMRPTVTLLI